MARAVEWQNVQALVRYGFRFQNHARYELLEIEDPVRARQWLKSNLGNFSYAVDEGEDVPRSDGGQEYRCNIAFTHDGLEKLGVQDGALASFSAEFREGIFGPSNGHKSSGRSARLGDTGPNDPKTWQWGGTRPHTHPVHIILMVFADGAATTHSAIVEISRFGDVSDSDDMTDPDWGARGLRLVEKLTSETKDMENPKEHFGFRDGISQPVIDDKAIRPDISNTNRTISTVKPGEFILGYSNERGVRPVSPIVDAVDDNSSKLPRRDKKRRDLGKNGTYLVLRQLRQDVQKFEKFLDDKFNQQPLGFAASDRHWRNLGKKKWKDWLSAKMVGRWPDGMPLTRHPRGEPASYHPETANDFFFAQSDPSGIKCPVGSHIRRTNPRDSLDKDPAQALRISKHRRIIRRGRIYGSKYDSANPDDGTGANERGLLFVCLNASIAEQFESIQHDWINSPQFGDLYAETDPLIGTRSKVDRSFTVPARPANLQFTGLDQFVTVRGAGYFFLPSKQAIDWLANI